MKATQEAGTRRRSAIYPATLQQTTTGKVRAHGPLHLRWQPRSRSDGRRDPLAAKSLRATDRRPKARRAAICNYFFDLICHPELLCIDNYPLGARVLPFGDVLCAIRHRFLLPSTGPAPLTRVATRIPPIMGACQSCLGQRHRDSIDDVGASNLLGRDLPD